MRFLADMGVSQQVVYWLRTNGHDAVHLRDVAFKGVRNRISLSVPDPFLCGLFVQAHRIC